MAENTKRSPWFIDFTWWIWNDKYLPVKNWCSSWEWLDIRRWKYVCLSTHNTNNIVSFPNNSQITWMGQDYYISDNWYLYTPTAETLYKFINTSNTDKDIRNYTDFTISWTNCTLLFGRSYITKFETLLTLHAETRTFNWAYWTLSDTTKYTHVTWNTWTLVWSAVTASSYYRVNFTVSDLTAWTFTVNIWWTASPITISANWEYTYFFETVDTTWLTITPSSDFDGTIETLDIVKLVTATERYLEMDNISLTCPLLEDTWDLYIGNGNILYKLSNDWILSSMFSLPDWTIIIWITKIDDTFIIWTRTNQWSRVLYWDWTSSAPTRTVYWYNETIQQVVNQWNYHLVFTGGDYWPKKIWYSNWYWKTMIFWINEWDWYNSGSNLLVPPIPLYRWGSSANNIYTNNIESFGDIVFMPWYEKVLVYWHKIPWFTDSMYADFPLDTKQIYSMYAYDWGIYVAYDNWSGSCDVINWKLNNYDTIKDDTNQYYYWEHWIINLQPLLYVWSKEKFWINLELWINTPENTFMNVYYNIDDEEDRYTLVIDQRINPTTILPEEWAIYTNWTGTPRYLVTKVITYLDYSFIEIQETTKWHTPRESKILTKISWTGDNTITYKRFNKWRHFDYVTSTTELTSRKRHRSFNEKFFELQLSIEHITRDGKVTPKLYNVIPYYDEPTQEW